MDQCFQISHVWMLLGRRPRVTAVTAVPTGVIQYHQILLDITSHNQILPNIASFIIYHIIPNNYIRGMEIQTWTELKSFKDYLFNMWSKFQIVQDYPVKFSLYIVTNKSHFGFKHCKEFTCYPPPKKNYPIGCLSL